MKKIIYILHSGKAFYPDIDAYKDYFEPEYEVIDGTLSEYKKLKNKSNTILWCLMGFHHKNIKAEYVIHDYRSLSVGRFSILKDLIKRFFNIKPDLRIFLNEQVSNIMRFNDCTPSCYLDMGVPKWIFDIKPEADLKGTFCYIGEMSFERRFDKVIDSFLKNKKNSQTFVLVGNPQKELIEKYSGNDSLIFTGKLSQKEALKVVKTSDFSVCYIPYHRPYCFQTPTKLLEYAALGVDIICNDSPSNLMTLKKHSIEAMVTNSNIFEGLDLKKSKYLDPQSIKKLEWTEVIRESGLEKFLALKGV